MFNKTLPTLKFYKDCIEIEQEYLEKESISTISDSKSHLIWLYEQACGFKETPSGSSTFLFKFYYGFYILIMFDNNSFYI